MVAAAEKKEGRKRTQTDRLGANPGGDSSPEKGSKKKAAPKAKGGVAKKEKKVKDPNAPKRPMSSFFLYSQEHRPRIKKENPGFTVAGVAKELGEQWRNASDAEKAPFEAEAAKLKAAYLKLKEASK